MYIPRALEKTVIDVSKSFPVLLLTGPRQVGKTTILQKLASPERKYVSLDDPDQRQLAKKDPGLFMQRFSPPVFIDEIQYAPELLPFIKMDVDRKKSRGDYWLTGSQVFHLMANISESLAGRVGILNMLGLSSSEIHAQESEPFTTNSERLMKRAGRVKKKGLSEIYEQIHIGGMPALYSEPEIRQEVFFSSYINTYLQRDIRELSQVADELSFYNFLVAMAARSSRPLIYEEIARELGISAPTVKRWTSILITSGMIALIQPYYNNALKRIIKTPIMHFLDTGLCAHLLKWKTPDVLESGAMSGQFFETWVFSEIYKSYINTGSEPPIFFYRDKDKKEIDLLLHYNGTLYPIEIKKSASPGASAIRHFTVLENAGMKLGEGSVICMANELLPIDRANWYVPAWLL